MARYGGAIELSDDRRPEVRSGVVMYGDTKEGALSEIKGGGIAAWLSAVFRTQNWPESGDISLEEPFTTVCAPATFHCSEGTCRAALNREIAKSF